MKRTFILSAAVATCLCTAAQTSDDRDIENAHPGYKLVFHDEFNTDGAPDANYWTYDLAHRNNEEQLYTTKNATCADGCLVIEARKEDAQDSKGTTYHYTSSSLVTKAATTGPYVSAWTYGRFEVRAKIPAYLGCWPAIWLLSNENVEWPYSGEIDMMEYYPVDGAEALHANVAWGTTTRWSAKWNNAIKKLADLEAVNANWKNEFHVWRMDWDSAYIRLYVDDELINTTNLDNTVNPRADYCWYDNYNPYRGHNMYLLLNLALGGDNGGSLANTPFPCQYLVDYVRVYQKDPNYKPEDDAQQGTNLLVNGDFEDLTSVTYNTENGESAASNIAGWQQETNVWNVYLLTPEHTGESSLIQDGNNHYVTLKRYAWNGWADGALKQTVATVKDHEYALSFLYRFNYGNYKGNRPKAGFQVYDGTSTSGTKLAVNEDIDPAGQWTRTTTKFTAASSSVLLRLFLDNPSSSWYNNDPCTLDLDEVRLVDLTETSAGIGAVENGTQPASSAYYDLQGRQLAPTRLPKGVYIHNGEKRLAR